MYRNWWRLKMFLHDFIISNHSFIISICRFRIFDENLFTYWWLNVFLFSAFPWLVYELELTLILCCISNMWSNNWTYLLFLWIWVASTMILIIGGAVYFVNTYDYDRKTRYKVGLSVGKYSYTHFFFRDIN